MDPLLLVHQLHQQGLAHQPGLWPQLHLLGLVRRLGQWRRLHLLDLVDRLGPWRQFHLLDLVGQLGLDHLVDLPGPCLQLHLPDLLDLGACWARTALRPDLVDQLRPVHLADPPGQQDPGKYEGHSAEMTVFVNNNRIH